MKVSVGTKIGAGYGLALIMFILLCLVSYQSTNALIEAAHLRTQSHVLLENLEQAVSALKDAETGQRGFLLTGEESYLEPYRAAEGTIDREIKEIRRSIADHPTQQRWLDALESQIAVKLAELKETIDLRRTQGFNAALEVVRTAKGKRTMDEIRRLITEMQKEEDETFKHLGKEVDAKAQNTIAVIVYGLLFSIIILGLAGYFITRNIAGPLKEITAAVEQMSTGEINRQVFSNHRNDEVGVLVKAFTQMTGYQQETVGMAHGIAEGNLTIGIKPRSEKDALGAALATMVESLRKITRETREGVTVMSASASEIVAATTQVAAGATETATALSQTTTTVEEVKQTAQIAAQKARHVSESAQKAVHVSQTGKKSVEQIIEAINRIRGQMESIAESIVSLSEQNQAIGEIIATVNDLAEQSNLLAVNAAIEAAKAGEQGKGFAVVAQEVKSLADQSKQATAQVRTILGDIQKATSAAVMATEQGSKAVEAGVQQSSGAGESIRLLAENIAEAAQAATQIAASAQQQLVGMDQVALAMENIKQASTQNVVSTKQAEMTAQNLHDLGQKLKFLVEQYRV